MVREPLFLRYLAGVVLAFAILNGGRELFSPGFSAAHILFYVPGFHAGADLCLALAAVLLGFGAFGPVRRRSVAFGLSAGLFVVAAVAVSNAVQFYSLIASGRLATSWPVPLSALVAAYLLVHAVFCVRPRHLRARADALARVNAPARPAPRRSAWAKVGALVAALATLFLVVVFHLHAQGLTDYRRPADAIVVLGARVYADGRPSEALRERVETAIALYHQGLSRHIIMSGGIGEGGWSEPSVMRAIAVSAGVPEEVLIEDPLGVNTEATVENVVAIARQHGMHRMLAVSHYHHLPRIRLLCARRGLQCFTVPADEGETILMGTPYYVLRETVALAWVYLKG